MADTPDFADYHRTIIGFHGTSTNVATGLVEGGAFRASDSKDDWLGWGIYFWEYAPKQAWWWAKRKYAANAAVVGAMIRLGNCFDLLDPKNLQNLKQSHKVLLKDLTDGGFEIPENRRQYRYLDCAVFTSYYQEAEETDKPIDSSRGVYVPTAQAKRLWKGSWIYDDAHIQICVRNQKNILSVWHVRKDGRYGKD